MIEALLNDDMVDRIGGRFKLTALIQKRWIEIMQGAHPLVDTTGKTELEVVVDEIAQGKIGIDYAASGLRKDDD